MTYYISGPETTRYEKTKAKTLRGAKLLATQAFGCEDKNGTIKVAVEVDKRYRIIAIKDNYPGGVWMEVGK